MLPLFVLEEILDGIAVINTKNNGAELQIKPRCNQHKVVCQRPLVVIDAIVGYFQQRLVDDAGMWQETDSVA